MIERIQIMFSCDVGEKWQMVMADLVAGQGFPGYGYGKLSK